MLPGCYVLCVAQIYIHPFSVYIFHCLLLIYQLYARYCFSNLQKAKQPFLHEYIQRNNCPLQCGCLQPIKSSREQKMKVTVTLFQGGTSKLHILGTSDPRLYASSYHDSLVVKGGTLGHLPSHDPISLVCFPSHVYILSVLRLVSLGNSLAAWDSTGHVYKHLPYNSPLGSLTFRCYAHLPLFEQCTGQLSRQSMELLIPGSWV